MMRKLSHVGIAVKSLNESGDLFSRLFGQRQGSTEEVPDQKLRTTFFRIGGTGVELLEPTGPESPVARFIEKRGEGFHHLSFEVDDIHAEIARLRKAGFQMIDEKPRPGADGYVIAFLHPKSTNGVLVEISQKSDTNIP